MAEVFNGYEEFILAINDVELTKQILVELNKRIRELEQKQGEAAHLFFTNQLSAQLIFHRASGKVVGKSKAIVTMNEVFTYQSRSCP